METRRRYIQTLTGIFVAILIFYRFIYFSNTSGLFWESTDTPTLYAVSEARSLNLLSNTYSKSTAFMDQLNNSMQRCINTSTDPSFFVCPYNSDQDVYVSAALTSDGVWEPYMTQVFQEALTNTPNATVVDIGANIGYYTLMAAARGHSVVAVEPTKESVRRLALATAMNGFGFMVKIVTNAISNKVEDVTLSIEESNQGAVHVIPAASSYWSSRAAGQGQTARAVTMNHIAKLVSSKDVIIKLDIEGYECKAIESADQFFKSLHVWYIFMEWKRLSSEQHKHASPCPARSLRRMTASLSSQGYIPYELRYSIPLQPSDTNSWKAGDIYWRHRDAPPLTPVKSSSARGR